MLEMTDEELIALGEDRRIQAIKMIRERTRLGLIEAVALVDDVGFKTGLLVDGPGGIGSHRLRPLRQNPDIVPVPAVVPASPEARYLREWAAFYEDKARGAAYSLPPTGVDPMKAEKAVRAFRKIDGILFNNSFRDKVARIKQIVLGVREELL